MFKIYFIGLKMTCLGVLERGNRDKINETGLKEEGGIEMSTTVLEYLHASLPERLRAICLRFVDRLPHSRRENPQVSFVARPMRRGGARCTRMQ